MFFSKILWKFNFIREIEWKNVIRCSRKRFFCKNEAQDESKGASEGSLESSRGSRVWLTLPQVPQFQRPGRSLRIKDPWKNSPAGCKLQTFDWKQDAGGLTRRWARRIINMRKYEKSMKIEVFGGSRGFPGSSRQLSTCRIDCRCQIQHPDWLDQPISTPKYQLYTPSGSITWYQQLQ